MTTTGKPPSAPPATSGPSTGSARTSGPSAGKLRMGELRALTAAYLIDNPGQHTPGSIARALGRSPGAVGNALATLTGLGQVSLSSERPVRYEATPSTTIAASAGPSRRPHPSVAPAPVTPATGTTSTGTASTSDPDAGDGANGPTGPASMSGTTRTARTGSTRARAEEPVRGPVRRPNGMTYHPRTLADLPDVAALRKLRAGGVAALLYGPPGTGKTSLIEAAFPDLITVAGDGDTAVADLIGEYVQTPDGRYEFRYGPLVVAMREGRALLIDDATLISPKVLAVVYPAMDGRREIVVKSHRGETIKAAEGFYVVAGHNPGVHGAVLTEALASRFAAQIHVSTDYDLAAALKIDAKAVRVARNLATKHTRGEIGWAPQLRELIAFQRVVTILGLDAAVANLVGIAPEEDRDVVASVVATTYGRTFTPLALGRQI